MLGPRRPITADAKRRRAIKNQQKNLMRRLRGLKPIDFDKKPTKAKKKPLKKKPLTKRPLTMTEKMLLKPIGAIMQPKKK